MGSVQPECEPIVSGFRGVIAEKPPETGASVRIGHQFFFGMPFLFKKMFQHQGGQLGGHIPVKKPSSRFSQSANALSSMYWQDAGMRTASTPVP